MSKIKRFKIKNLTTAANTLDQIWNNITLPENNGTIMLEDDTNMEVDSIKESSKKFFEIDNFIKSQKRLNILI